MTFKTGHLWRLATGMVLALQVCLAWQADTLWAATIALKVQASVDQEEFTLEQIATVTGPTDEQIDFLSGLVMGKSPMPGRSLRLYPATIEQKLKQQGVDLSQHRLDAQGPVKVHRRFAALSPQKIETALRAFIQANAPWQADQMKIRPIKYRQKHQLPPGRIDLRVTAPRHGDWIGSETFVVNISVNNNMVKRINVPVFIEVWGNVALSAKPLGRGQPIAPDDIVIRRMNLARVPSNAVVNPDLIMGSTAKRAITINTILCSDQFVSPPVIRRGDVVRVVAESDHLKITTRAVAREDGGKGERIELMNLQSNKKIFAQVVNCQTVKVQF